MSVSDFYPMKKRKLCKTPNGSRDRRSIGSTLGKLRRSSGKLRDGKNAAEIVWDNNSPSPTTTMALGKRRRKPKGSGSEENEISDISFVVQQLSENASPVLERSRSALLEVWINKDKENNCLDEQFSSPPCQTRHERTKDPLDTPLNQRKTSKRSSRKATRQFMLEIRRLVEEIQRSDLSSNSSQSQKEERCVEQPNEIISSKQSENSKVITAVRQISSTPHQSGVTTLATAGTTNLDRYLEDSFELTEDDMDELMLTCQLSSSGKGSADVAEVPGPMFGFSPTDITHVPGTQLLAQADVNALQISCMRQSDATPVELERRDSDVWDVNFDEDDSLLASVVQEFERSQEAMRDTNKRGKHKNECEKIAEDISSFEELTAAIHPGNYRQEISRDFSYKKNEHLVKSGRSRKIDFEAKDEFSKYDRTVVNQSPCDSKRLLDKRLCVGRINGKLTKNTSELSSSERASGVEENAGTSKTFERKNAIQKCDSLAGNDAEWRETEQSKKKTDAKVPRQQLHGNEKSTSTFRSIEAENNLSHEKLGRSRITARRRSEDPTNEAQIPTNSTQKNVHQESKAFIENKQQNDFDFWFAEDNFAVLLEDIDFEDVVNEATAQKECSTSLVNFNESVARSSAQVSTPFTATKRTYSKDEIEQKRLEARRRRLAKQQCTTRARIPRK